jgi:hypothetical protein
MVTRPPDAEMSVHTELDPQAEPNEGSPAPPLPGGEVRDPRERLQLSDRTGRLVVQEVVRAGLAFSFVVLLAIVVVLGFHYVNSKNWPNAREALEILVPTLSALIGSATGFYFGTRR